MDAENFRVFSEGEVTGRFIHALALVPDSMCRDLLWKVLHMRIIGEMNIAGD